jgi:GNAT superfamily N-acetyltransferase
MIDDYKIVYVEEPEEAAKIIGTGIQSHIKEQAGDHQPQRLCFVPYSADDEIVGGVIGDQHRDWVYVDVVWVQDTLRGLGYGRQLRSHFEKEAVKRGVTKICLTTFSFQATGFYH